MCFWYDSDQELTRNKMSHYSSKLYCRNHSNSSLIKFWSCKPGDISSRSWRHVRNTSTGRQGQETPAILNIQSRLITWALGPEWNPVSKNKLDTNLYEHVHTCTYKYMYAYYNTKDATESGSYYKITIFYPACIITVYLTWFNSSWCQYKDK